MLGITQIISPSFSYNIEVYKIKKPRLIRDRAFNYT
jgi:hypothetical protein